VLYNQIMKKSLTIISVVVGVGCLVAAYIYWTTPANMLPTVMPGFDPSLTTIHIKHGLAALIVGIALFVFAWFRSGKKKPSVADPQQ